MVRCLMLLMLLVCTIAVMSGAVAEPQADPAKEIGRSTELFAAKVYQELKSQPGNLLICPISVQTVLALVQAGANGDTSDDIQRALLLPQDKTKTQQGFQNLMQSLLRAKYVAMDIANRVFVKEDVKIHPNFKEIAVKAFAAGIENVNFANPPKSAAHINQWVESKTNNRIKDLISSDMITESTRMILVNALYFKGKWASQFESWATRLREFYLNEVDTVKVPMMHQTGYFKYAENANLDCKFLEMPYEGGEFAMTIVLPNQKNGLTNLEARMGEVLAPQNYNSERVDIIMPKFSMDTKIEFNDVLKKLGMASAFSASADFRGITANGELLQISDVIQKNFINVTEQGTEAASATAVGVVTLSLPSFPTEFYSFYVDRPFLYLIRHKTNGTPLLFLGRYIIPQNN